MRNAVLMGLAAATMSACTSAPAPGSAAAAAAGNAPKATYFTVPAAQQSHIAVVRARTTAWETTVGTTGTVDWDNDHTTQAITQVSGPITRIAVDAGTRVKANDPLLYVASADVANAVAAYRKAQNRLALSQKTVDRGRDLLAHKALAQADFEAMQADYNDASTDVQTSLQALKVFGVTADDLKVAEQQNAGIRPELAMRAPFAGTIVQKLVLPGQFIQAGATVAFVISNVSTVWVQGHVYDKDLPSVHLGDKVEARNGSFPQTFRGVVSYIGEMIDPATRTTPVRIVTENIDGLLKKDLFLDIVIHDRTSHDVLVVPTAAVLYDDQNFPFVYIQVAPGQFAERLVKIGGQQGEDTQVLDGLKAGDSVIGQGSLFLQFANTYQQ